MRDKSSFLSGSVDIGKSIDNSRLQPTGASSGVPVEAMVDLSGIQWRYMSKEGRAWMALLDSRCLQGEEFKANDKRRVLRSRGAYVKEVSYHGMRRWLKTLAGGTACMEGRKYLRLSQRGVAIPEVLAFGQEARGGLIRRDILITREVKDARNFFDVVFGDYRVFPLLEKRKLIRSFAEFVHRVHRAGIYHHDLHIGNILISSNADGNRFFLLDSDQMRFFPKELSKRKKAENLALLLINFQKITTRTERCRFLKYYGLVEGRDRLDRQMLTSVERKGLKKSVRSWHKRALRSVGNNNYFVAGRKSQFNIFSQRSSLARNAIDVLLPDPDKIMGLGEVLKAGRTIQAATVLIDGRKYFLKRYNDKGLVYSLRNIFRKSRAVSAWLVSWELFLRGLPVPEPILCLEEKSFLFLKRSYILYEHIENSLRLPQKWPLLDTQTRKSVLIYLAIKLGWMHRTGGVHGDLKWNNILIDENNRIHFIDFDGSRIVFPCSTRKSSKDLARFLKDLGKFEEDEDLKLVFNKVATRWH